MAIAPLPSLLASIVANAQVTATETATANSTADASLSQANAENLIGANQSAFSLAGAGSVLGGVTANLSATATSTEGNADATAGGLSTANLVGVQGLGDTAAISVNGTGSLQGSVAATLTATATSTAANGSASAGSNDVAGVRAGDILISGAGTIAGLAQLTQGATARSTAGSGNADAQVNQIFGLVVGDEAADLQIGGVGALYGAVSLLSTATAITTGNDAASDSATATQRVGSAIGLDLTGPTAAATSSSIGGAAAITGQAEVTGSANASATTGNSSATAGAFVTGGGPTDVIGLRPSESASLRGNGAAVVTAAGSGVFTAQASTSTGGATANVDGNVFGANGTAGQIAIGANGVLNASAVLDATAIASTVDGDGNNASATITPLGGSVIGISLGNTDGGVLINGSGAISGTAQLLQQASATAISGGNATAQVGTINPFDISGIFGTVVEIDGNSTGFVADAVVNSTATANAGSGTADASTQSGVVADAFKNSVLRIAGASSGSLQATSAVTDTLRASSVEGNATAETLTTRATGIANGSVQVNGQAGTLLSTSTYNLTVDAQSTSANASANGGAQQASQAYGLRDGNVSFGADGSALFAATTNATINSLSTAGTSDSYANFLTKGIEFRQITGGGNQDISIAVSGSIASQASVLGSVSSTSVASSASSEINDLETFGLFSDSQNNNISIGGTGMISMSANVGSIDTPFLVTAASVGSDADALINQGNPASAITSGAKGTGGPGDIPTSAFLGAGTISATADTNLSLRAVSTNGNSRAELRGTGTAGTETFDNFGISDVNLTIQQVAGGVVTGLSNARLEAISTSTNGDASAILRGQSAGITSINDRNTINSSSTVGQGQLLSTSLARTVGGSAVAESGSIVGELVVGINQYDITSAGSGGITAGAAHRAMSTATSVSGSARALGTL